MNSQNSPFVSEHHGHVTSSPSIVSNEALRGLIKKGPKVRKQNKTKEHGEKTKWSWWKQLKLTSNYGQREKISL